MIKVINVHRDARYKGFSQFVKVCCLLSPLFPSLMWPYPSFVTYHLWATNCALCGPNLSWDGLKKDARILNIKKQAVVWYTLASLSAISVEFNCVRCLCWKGLYIVLFTEIITGHTLYLWIPCLCISLLLPPTVLSITALISYYVSGLFCCFPSYSLCPKAECIMS